MFDAFKINAHQFAGTAIAAFLAFTPTAHADDNDWCPEGKRARISYEPRSLSFDVCSEVNGHLKAVEVDKFGAIVPNGVRVYAKFIKTSINGKYEYTYGSADIYNLGNQFPRVSYLVTPKTVTSNGRELPVAQLIGYTTSTSPSTQLPSYTALLINEFRKAQNITQGSQFTPRLISLEPIRTIRLKELVKHRKLVQGLTQ